MVGSIQDIRASVCKLGFMAPAAHDPLSILSIFSHWTLFPPLSSCSPALSHRTFPRLLSLLTRYTIHVTLRLKVITTVSAHSSSGCGVELSTSSHDNLNIADLSKDCIVLNIKHNILKVAFCTLRKLTTLCCYWHTLEIPRNSSAKVSCPYFFTVWVPVRRESASCPLRVLSPESVGEVTIFVLPS